MKHWLLAIACLFCLAASGQSPESDAAFAKGVSLYRAGDFKGAVPYFQLCDSLDRAQCDTATTVRWGYARTWLANSLYRAGNRDEAVTLDNATFYIEPYDRRETVEIDKLIDQAKQCYNRQDLAGAEKYQRLAYEAEVREFGPESAAAMYSLYELGVILYQMGDLPGSMDHFNRADAIARKEPFLLDGMPHFYYMKRGNSVFASTFSPSLTLDMARPLYDECKQIYAYVKPLGDNYLGEQASMVLCLLRLGGLQGLYDDCILYDRALIDLWDRMDDKMKYGFSSIVSHHLDYLEAVINLSFEAIDSQRLVAMAEDALREIANHDGEYSLSYADMLINRGRAYGYVGRLVEAIDDIERGIRIFTLNGGGDEPFLVPLYVRLCNYAMHIPKPDKGIQFAARAEALRKQFLPENKPLEAYLKYVMGQCYDLKGDYGTAAYYVRQALDLYDTLGSDCISDHISALMVLADCQAKDNDMEASLATSGRAIDLHESTDFPPAAALSNLHLTHINTLESLGRRDEAEKERQSELDNADRYGNYANIYRRDLMLNRAVHTLGAGKPADAIAMLDELDEYCKKNGMQQLTQSLTTRAKCNLALGETDKAIDMYRQALDIIVAIEGEDGINQAQGLMDLASAYSSAMRLDDMAQCLDKAKDIYLKTYGEDLNYLNCLISIGSSYAGALENRKALEYLELAQKVQKRLPATNMSTEIDMLLFAISTYMITGDYDKLKAVSLEAKDLFEAKNMTHTIGYGGVLNGLAFSARAEGNYRAALDYYQQALNLVKSIEPSKSEAPSAMIYGEMANTYKMMGDMASAQTYDSLAASIRRENASSSYYLTITVQFQDIYATLMSGDYDKAEQMLDDVYKQMSSTLGDDANLMVLVQMFYALIEFGKGFNDNAIEICDQAYERVKKHRFYMRDFHNGLANMYLSGGQHKKAVNVAREMLETDIKMFGKSSYQVADDYGRLAQIYLAMGDNGNASKYIGLATDLGRDVLLNGFTTMTSEERANFWNVYYPFFRDFVPQAVMTLPHTKDNLRTVYNTTLLGTGILLEADRNLGDMVRKQGSADLNDLYDTFLATKAQHGRVVGELANADDAHRIRLMLLADSLADATKRHEISLMDRVKAEVGDFTSSLRVQWDDVRSRLKQADAAVEFIEFDLPGDSVCYAALTLRRGYSAPKLTRLFAQPKSDALCQDSPYETDALTRRVWQPLAAELADTKRVYFATQGQLCNVAIESMPDTDGQLLSAKRDYYRLSSTRELALDAKGRGGRDAVVYGGLNYDMGADAMADDARKYPGLKRDIAWEPDSAMRAAGRSIPPLPGTLAEADSIVMAINAAERDGLTARKLVGNDGTEASFKALSGQGLRMLHIGTHGYYFTADDIERNSALQRLLSTGADSRRSGEDRMLQRSGLFLSGALNNYGRRSVPQGVEDGILSAREIATLDFKDLDLVVLSACETAKGDILGEGVFGLQRGFKKAGANSLLMSLWKVDDTATQRLMTTFYRQLMAGDTKHQALERAKADLRSDPAYASPQFWAAFILLDAKD